MGLFGFAILAAGLRTAIRLRYQKRLFVDDGFLFLAIVFLIASMVLLWFQFDEMYLAEALVTNQDPPPKLPKNFFAQLIHFLKFSDAFLVLSWSSVLAVKFSFLFFFRSLIDRVPHMMYYWWTTVGITFCVWAFGCGAVFAPCPYFDFRLVNCSQDEEYEKAVAYSVSIIALDIFTDILIIIIPIYLISQIRIKLRQKFILGFSLCLSIFIIIISIICAAGIRSPTSHAIDITWELFWQTAESCVAVTMASFIAFRSFFVAHASRNQRSPYDSGRRRLWRKNVQPNTSSTGDANVGSGSSRHFTPAPRVGGLPSIPNARLSGLATMFRRGRFRSNEDIMRSQMAEAETWRGSGSARMSAPSGPSSEGQRAASGEASAPSKPTTGDNEEPGVSSLEDDEESRIDLPMISNIIDVGGYDMPEVPTVLLGNRVPSGPAALERQSSSEDSVLWREDRNSEMSLPIQVPSRSSGE